jgi:uncharacterized protein YbjT (DUF2867 family)
MLIAVAGGTGVVGRMVVEAARTRGHEPVVISRARGVDLVHGTGLPEALRDVDAVIDVANTGAMTKSAAVEFFGTATNNLLAAEKQNGVGHHVALSIVGIDRVPTGYYQGKLRQEQLIAAGGVPWTVLRATQFHEFPVQVLSRVKGPVAPVPRMRSATVAAREVAEHLVTLATAPPRGMAPELAGPQVHDMVELARRVLRARGERRVVVPVRLPGRAGAAFAADGLLPTGDGPRGRQTFDEWLDHYVHPSAAPS